MKFVMIVNGLRRNPLPQREFEKRVHDYYLGDYNVEFKMFDSYPDYIEIQAIITSKGDSE